MLHAGEMQSLLAELPRGKTGEKLNSVYCLKSGQAPLLPNKMATNAKGGTPPHTAKFAVKRVRILCENCDELGRSQ